MSLGATCRERNSPMVMIFVAQQSTCVTDRLHPACSACPHCLLAHFPETTKIGERPRWNLTRKSGHKFLKRWMLLQRRPAPDTILANRDAVLILCGYHHTYTRQREWSRDDGDSLACQTKLTPPTLAPPKHASHFRSAEGVRASSGNFHHHIVRWHLDLGRKMAMADLAIPELAIGAVPPAVQRRLHAPWAPE